MVPFLETLDNPGINLLLIITSESIITIGLNNASLDGFFDQTSLKVVNVLSLEVLIFQCTIFFYLLVSSRFCFSGLVFVHLFAPLPLFDSLFPEFSLFCSHIPGCVSTS